MGVKKQLNLLFLVWYENILICFFFVNYIFGYNNLYKNLLFKMVGMSQEQLLKGKFNLIELVNSENGFYVTGKLEVIVKPELLDVFVIRGFTMAAAKKLMLEELSWLNGGYKSQEDLKIPIPPEETNAYFFGVGIDCSAPRLFDHLFFPVVYCHIDESYLE